MMKEKGFLLLVLLSVPFLFASGESDNESDSVQVQVDTAGIDSAEESVAGNDSGTTDSTFVDSVLAALATKRAEEKSRKPILPELHILPSEFVDFFDRELVLQGEELDFKATFIVLGKAVYGHFDFMMVGDSGTAATVKSTDNRSYRSDKGGSPKTLAVNLGPAAGVVLVKAAFHEMRVEPDKGLCVTGK